MSAYNDNAIYLSIDATVVHAYFKSVQLTPSIEEVDITRGSGIDYRQKAGGLKDYRMTITLGYETTLQATHLPLIKPGIHTIAFGPEGNTAGKPKHAGSFLITESPIEISVEKSEVAYQVTAMQADVPTSDMYNGDTW